MTPFSINRFDIKNQLKDLPESGKILIAPLNWGLGHATRCIPLIKQLIAQGFEIIIASDGAALLTLKNIFPQVISYQLPSYQIRYAKNPWLFNLILLKQLPHILITIEKEKQLIAEIVEKENIKAIISDNRFGAKNHNIPSILISHQLRIKKGIGGFLATKWHQKIINSFDICWIPDAENEPNLSGELSHNIKLNIPKRYIGLLSPFQFEVLPELYDKLILLSGPEPSRSLLEKKLRKKFNNTSEKICMVRGVVESESTIIEDVNMTIFNFALGKTLQDLLNSSRIIIARTGYSTLMDLAVLQKNAILIPTPGQPEQEYLAKFIAQKKYWEILNEKDL